MPTGTSSAPPRLPRSELQPAPRAILPFGRRPALLTTKPLKSESGCSDPSWLPTHGVQKESEPCPRQTGLNFRSWRATGKTAPAPRPHQPGKTPTALACLGTSAVVRFTNNVVVVADFGWEEETPQNHTVRIGVDGPVADHPAVY